MKYDLVVYIGRFQPPHIGHFKTIIKAKTLANRVLVLVGSSNSPRTIKNPFSFSERKFMIEENLVWTSPSEYLNIEPLPDNMYKTDRWVASVQEKVDSILMDYSLKNKKDSKVALIGYIKDASSYYLKYFPQWDFIEVDGYEKDKIDSTDIRNILFEGKSIRYLKNITLSTFLEEFKMSEEFKLLKEEYDFIKNYDPSEFPRNEVTADAVVIQSGHILLIQRKHVPGKGLYALPGGFISPDERILDGLIRELKEETNLRVPTKVLIGSIKSTKVFDNPTRSDRGRIITHVFKISLKDGEELPRVSGSDDAKEAFWMPIGKVLDNPQWFYSDHWSIIEDMV